MSIFDSIAVKRTPESVFDLSREVKGSFNMGQLIPILLEETIPGDVFKGNSEVMIRLAPMLSPVMHKVNVYVHYFEVPNRLVWDNFHDHITGGDDGLANPAHPEIVIKEETKDKFKAGLLPDYLGIPTIEAGTNLGGNVGISALPFRAYQLIFNDYYRDQDLHNKQVISTADGEDNITSMRLLTRAWEKDYFTSARPTSQKGPEVRIPLQGSITPKYKTTSNVYDVNGAPLASTESLFGTVQSGLSTDPNGSDKSVYVDNLDGDIDLTSVGMSVEDQRTSNRLQEWLELASRGGSRINEIIRNFFGVVPDDLRLMRPKYLGGGKQKIIMSEVLNTAGGVDSTTLQPLGEYGGHGISVGNQNSFSATIKEHGYIMGIMSVIPVTNYAQGLHRHWTKFDKYEKYWPQFAQLGEQEIKNYELYLDYEDSNENNVKTFGYTPRYAEYKYGISSIHGDMRKDSTGDKLSYWTMYRHFENRPVLNDQFVEADPTHHIFAVTDPTIHKLYYSIYHNIKAKRKMPYYNNPTL